MTFWPALLVALLARGVAAEPPPPVDGVPAETDTAPQGLSDPPPERSAADRLNDAVMAYQAGHREDARNALAELVNDPALDDPLLRQRARVYLGEVLYVEGQEDAAFRAFEQVLEFDPGFRIDPFEHPPDVCGFFEVVRASTISLRPVLPPPPRPLPATAWMGFGLYQRGHGHKTAGNLLLASEAVLGATSVVAFGLMAYDRRWSKDNPAEHTRILTTMAVQWTAGLGFWGLYAAGTVNAHRDWREQGTTAGGSPPPGSALQIGTTVRW